MVMAWFVLAQAFVENSFIPPLEFNSHLSKPP